MNDYFGEQISEFIDDEMSVEESEFFVRRLQRDDDARRRYLRYQLIGAAVRGEYRYPGATEIRRRFGAALDSDGQSAAPASWMQIGGGVGIAAGVVVIAILGFRLMAPESVTELAAAAAPAATFDRIGPASDSVIANDAAAFASVPGAVTGIQYLINHAQYTSGLNRTIVQSSVVAGRESDLVAAANEAVGLE